MPMRSILPYAVSSFAHVLIGVGVACWFGAGDSDVGLIPGTGNGAGMNLEFMPAGMPGGNPLPSPIVYFETSIINPSLDAAPVAATLDELRTDPLSSLAPTETRLTREDAPLTALATALPSTMEGPKPLEATDVAVPVTQMRANEKLPEIVDTLERPTNQRRATVELTTVNTTAAPPPNPGTGQGGVGTGDGRGVGDALGGGGGGAGGRADGPPEIGRGNLPPVYPPDAIRSRIAGRVVLLAQVDAEGYVTSLEVQNSSNWPSLDKAALDAVRVWRFLPARRGGISIPFSVLVPVRFNIEDAASE